MPQTVLTKNSLSEELPTVLPIVVQGAFVQIPVALGNVLVSEKTGNEQFVRVNIKKNA